MVDHYVQSPSPTRELDLADGGALVVGRRALVGAVVALADAPDPEEGAGGAVGRERRRVEPLLRVARRRPLTVRLVLPVNLRRGLYTRDHL